jgi:hypothetical protein
MPKTEHQGPQAITATERHPHRASLQRPWLLRVLSDYSVSGRSCSVFRFPVLHGGRALPRAAIRNPSNSGRERPPGSNRTSTTSLTAWCLWPGRSVRARNDEPGADGSPQPGQKKNRRDSIQKKSAPETAICQCRSRLPWPPGCSMSAHLDAILQALGGHRTADDVIMVLCLPTRPEPLPEYHRPARQVAGEVFRGCDQAAVVAALKARGLWLTLREAGRSGRNSGQLAGQAADDALVLSGRRQHNLGYVARYDGPDGKDVVPFFRRDGGRWAPGAAPVPRPLYCLDELPGFTGDILTLKARRLATRPRS